MTLVQRLIGDGIVAAGMLGALNADFVANEIEKGFHVIIKSKVTRNTNLAQHVKRIANSKRKKVTYNVLKLVLMAGFLYNLAYNTLAGVDERRSAIVNVLYFFYPLVTWTSTLKDILLDDDVAEWSVPDKQRYILFPVNLVDNKVLGKPLYGDQKVTQVFSAHKKMCETTVFGHVAVLLLLAKFCPPAAYVLWAFYPFLVHERLNTHLNAIADYVTLTEVKNKYEHLFGTYSSIFTGPEEDDKLGMQYEMFTRSFKPAAAFFKKRVFSKLRKSKYSVANSLAVTYVARGLFFSSLFRILNLQDTVGAVGAVVYYCLQTIVPLNSIESRFMEKSPFFRLCWYVIETMLSGFLFYKPLLNNFRDMNPVLVGTIAVAAVCLEYYNRKELVEHTINDGVTKVSTLLGLK